MGKSPGKWIKAVLFGKKTFKSKSSKRRQIAISAYEKTLAAPVEEPVSTLAVDPSFTSEAAPVNITGENENIDPRSGDVCGPPNEELVLYSKQHDEAQTAINDILPYDSDRIRLEQAATKAQATFRGYLARRAFRTLKGIIRLQAVVRGHLVRRQAIVTLYCLQGIVKFQALVRGQMIRHSDIGSEVRRKIDFSRRDARLSHSSKANTYGLHEKLLKNAFICQLLSSSASAMPLCLQYNPEEPNSAWNWLLRWTMLRACGLSFEPKKTVNLKQKVETQKVGPKHSRQRKQSGSVENASARPISDSEKLKCNQMEALNAVKLVRGQPRNEIVKIKHNVKKISSSASEDSIQKDVSNEKPKRNHDKKVKIRTVPRTDDSVGDLDGLMSDAQHKQQSVQNDTISDIDKDSNSMEEQTNNENHRISMRRASLPAKHHDQETEQRGTRVPSYMVATQSAKAKVIGQISPMFGQDVEEKNGPARRLSLPSSLNGKQNSSPCVQRRIQVNGKGGIKINRSLSSSRDSTDKVMQAEWKR